MILLSQFIALNYRKLLPVFFYLISLSSLAQPRIFGQVTDAYTRLPLQEFVINHDSITRQFSAGEFQLLIERFPATIKVLAPGYLPVRMVVNSGKLPLTISLIPENIPIQEIRVSAFLSNKRLFDSPGQIGLLTHRQLTVEPTFTLAPSLNKIPGVWMQNGTLNTNRLTIRGIGTRSPYGTNKIRAYYADIPLTNGVGETILEDLDLNQIATIEIVKGPSSAVYGSGLGGVLLLNPLKAQNNQLSSSVSVGSFGTINSSAKLSLATKSSGHTLVYSRLQSDGYRENNQTDRQNLSLVSAWNSEHTRVDLIGAFVWMDAFIPSSLDQKNFVNSPEKAAANWMATRGYENYSKAFSGLSVSRKFDQDWQFKLSAFGHFNRNNELRPFNILQEENFYAGFRSVLEKNYHTDHAALRLLIGNEFFHEKYSWQTLQNKDRKAGALISDNLERRRYHNLFVMTELDLSGKFLFSGQMNLNTTAYTYDDLFLANGDLSASYRFKPVVSPRLSAVWFASEKLRLFSVLSHGFSVPTLEETLLPSGGRNTSIKPETGWSFEIGAKTKIGSGLQVELSAYAMKVRNLLVARRTAEDEYIGLNAGKTNHPGIEVSIGYRLVNRVSWSSDLRMNAHLTDYRFSDFLDQENDYSGNKLTGSPNSTTNWMLETKHKNGLFLNLHLQTVGRIPMRDDNSVFADSYELVNLMTGYEKSFGNLSAGIFAGIQNLMNTRYASMILINASSFGTQLPRYYYPGLPLNYITRISLKYNF